MSAFKPPTGMSEGPNSGATQYRLVEIRPDSSFSGNHLTLPKSVRFQYKGAPRVFPIPAEAFFLLTAKVTDGGGNDLVVGDDLALSQFAGLNIWDKIRTLVARKEIDVITYPSQQGVLTNLSTRSSAWQETAGSVQLGQLSFADRQPLTYSSSEVDIVIRIPSGFWSSESLIAGVPITVEFGVSPYWGSALMESNAVVPAVVGVDYIPNIVDMRLFIPEYESAEAVAPMGRILEIRNPYTQAIPITAATSSANTLGFPSPAFKLFAAFQDSAAGQTTGTNLNEFTKATTVTDITVKYAGTTYPQTAYDMGFATRKGLSRPYLDFVGSAFADVDPSGCSIDAETWREFQQVFGFKLVAGEDRKDTNFVITTKHSAALTATLYLMSVHAQTLVFLYNREGMVERVEVVTSEDEAKSVLSAML